MNVCTCGGQKRVWDPLELELHMVVSHHMGQKLNPGLLEEQASALNHQTTSPAR